MPTKTLGGRFRISRGLPYMAPRSQYRGDTQQRFKRHPAHWTKIGCKEYGCDHYAKGWITKINLSPFQGQEDIRLNQMRYNWIRDHSERKFCESLEGAVAVFHFEAEQTCFREHIGMIERDPMFFHNRKRIDYDQFFDEFQETDYQVARRVQSG